MTPLNREHLHFCWQGICREHRDKLSLPAVRRDESQCSLPLEFCRNKTNQGNLLLSHVQNDQCRQSNKFKEAKKASFILLMTAPVMTSLRPTFLLTMALARREPTTNGRTVIKHFRKEKRTFARRARQLHTKTSRMRPAATPPQGLPERRNFACGGTGPKPSFFPRRLDRGPCHLCRPTPRQHRRHLHSIISDKTSTESSRDGLGFLNSLTSNVPKRRHQGISSSLGSNVKTLIGPTYVVRVAVGFKIAVDLSLELLHGCHASPFNWMYVPTVYQIWISTCNCWLTASDECHHFSSSRSQQTRAVGPPRARGAGQPVRPQYCRKRRSPKLCPPILWKRRPPQFSLIFDTIVDLKNFHLSLHMKFVNSRRALR